MSWQITPDKYMVVEEVQLLLTKLDELSKYGLQKWQKCWMLSELLLKTGIRIAEAQGIRHKDIDLGSSQPKIFITGKGGKKRFIPLGDNELREHIKQYVEWKRSILQGVTANDYFFQSKNQNKYSISGLQQLFKLGLREIGLEKRFSCHSCRHGFSVAHYSRNLDLRGLQLILGHANPSTTQVYCHRPFAELIKSTRNLY